MVEIANKTKRKVAPASLAKLCSWLEGKRRGEKWELSLVIIGPRRMRRLNREFRGLDRSTDILTFPGPDFGKVKTGEIFLCPEEIAKDSKYSFIPEVSRRDRLAFILIHGWLHLLGYDDEQEEDRLKMVRLGGKILAQAKKDGII